MGKLHGARELDQVLQRLPDRVAKQVADNAVRAGGRVVASETKLAVPVDTGALQDSIVVRSVRGEPGKAVVGFLKPRSRIAHLLEFGTSKMAARPFFRPALDVSARAAINEIGRVLGNGLERAARRLAGPLTRRQRRRTSR